MRVLLVNAHGADVARGGAERYVCEICSGLIGAGHEVNVLSAFPAQDDGLDGRSVVLHATDWRDNNRRRLANHFGDLVANPSRRLQEAVAAARPDVVHTNNLPGISTAIWETCRRLRIPVVHTIHDYYLLCPRVTLRRRDGTPCCPHNAFCRLRTARLTRWSPAVSVFVAVSDHVRGCHERLLPGARFHVIRIPVAPLSDAQLGVPRSPPRTIGYMGALDRVKGIEDLLEAAPELRRGGYTVQVVGDGSLRRLVEAAAERGDVRYFGRVHGDKKLAFVESTDLAVLPSRWDEPGAPPYAVAEWLSASRPILVSRRGGLDEVAHMLPGAVGIERGPAGIVAGVRRTVEVWSELVASIPSADVEASGRWLDRHLEVYELALGRRRP
jgi:glycosyltransferase involved in cell wall biosynthesis